MPLDIHSAVQTALILTFIALIFLIWQGIRYIRKARTLTFFRMRRINMERGWRFIGWALLMVLLIIFLNTLAEPLVYRIYPPTPTFTLTPTITLTPTTTLSPTITLTPSITPSPEVSYTPTASATPHIPLAIEMEFISTTTPNPDAVFSQLTFTDGLDAEYRPLKPGTTFQNPIGHMYALFSYDLMVNGSQWTALWLRDGELVHFETIPWDGGSGGLGYTDWAPDPSEWLPGTYEVQIFVGLDWKRGGTFTVEGEPPTPEPSATPTPTLTPTRTPIPSRTPRPSPTRPPTQTPRPTRTPYLSPTPSATRTPWPTVTPIPTRTPRPTRTPYLSPTPTPTRTPWPTAKPRPTRTPRPTSTPYISPTPTFSRTPWPTSTRTPVTPTATRYPTLTRTPVTPSPTPYPTLTRTRTPTPRP